MHDHDFSNRYTRMFSAHVPYHRVVMGLSQILILPPMPEMIQGMVEVLYLPDKLCGIH